ncbi:MAG: flagellar biosynthesis protein FlhB [Candidatus Eremiobacteraeota bacterium]|nr:flagellar biosynthesis protein FlhB [Candidatus Eremiobacteraeota bacterium]
MSQSDSDKTEEPTDHKLQEARKKGQVFKSQEISQTLVLLGTASVLGFLGSWMVGEMSDFIKALWKMVPEIGYVNPANIRLLMFQVWVLFMKVLAPLLLVGFVVALASNLAQVKFLFSTHPLTPTWQKISPIEGLKRIFSARSLMELAKQLAKLFIVGYICYKLVKAEIPNFRMAVIWDIPTSLNMLRHLVMRIVEYVVVAMAGIAVIDYLFQRWQFMKQMRMSIQELKDEYKDTEGNPQVKAKIRQLMRQGVTNRMMQDVPDATAVITNPTHIAVALRYKQGEDPAPVIVAKGERLIALQIKSIAEDNDVPIVENVALAKSLFSAGEVGEAIPPDLYKAVAEVLAYIFKLKRKKEQMRRRRYRMSARQYKKKA